MPSRGLSCLFRRLGRFGTHGFGQARLVRVGSYEGLPGPRPRLHGCLRARGRGRIGPAACSRDLAHGLYLSVLASYVRLLALQGRGSSHVGPARLPVTNYPSLKCRRLRAKSCGVRYGYVRAHGGRPESPELPKATVPAAAPEFGLGLRPVGPGHRLVRLAPPAAADSPHGSQAVSSPGQFPVAHGPGQFPAAHGPSVPRVSSPWLTGLQLPSQPRGAQAVSSPRRRRRGRPRSIPLSIGLAVPQRGLHARVAFVRYVTRGLRTIRAFADGCRSRRATGPGVQPASGARPTLRPASGEPRLVRT